MSAPKYDGVPVRVGGRDLVVPSLSYRATKKLMREQMPVLQGLQSELSDEQEAVVFEVILASLQRNYPEIDANWLQDECSIHEVVKLIPAVIEATLGKVPPGEGPQAVSP